MIPTLEEISLRSVFRQFGYIPRTEAMRLVCAHWLGSNEGDPIQRTEEILKRTLKRAERLLPPSQLTAPIAHLVKETEDKNLETFFSYLILKFPLGLRLPRGAHAIRVWMRENPDALLRIKHLELGERKNIRILPPEVNYLRELTTIDISNSSVEFLPDRLNLPNLRIFYLHSTNIEEFPPQLNLPQLREIYFAGTRIRSLLVGTFPHLQRLSS
jgi:hypothetical protein